MTHSRIYPEIRRTRNGPHSPSFGIMSDRIVTQPDFSFDWFGCATSALIVEEQEFRFIYLAITAQRSVGKWRKLISNCNGLAVLNIKHTKRFTVSKLEMFILWNSKNLMFKRIIWKNGRNQEKKWNGGTIENYAINVEFIGYSR